MLRRDVGRFFLWSCPAEKKRRRLPRLSISYQDPGSGPVSGHGWTSDFMDTRGTRDMQV